VGQVQFRKWFAAALAVALVAGCGGQGSEESGGELTFASWQWLEPGRGEQLWKVATGYTATDPAVTLKQQAVARKDYESTLKTQIGGRGGPDLLIIPDTFLPELADAGALEPLDGVVDKAVLNATNEAGKVDGKQLGYAWEIVNYLEF
jgi:multiple sugar transport system substrate-binding protein